MTKKIQTKKGIKYIAEIAKVSKSTVSRALRNDPEINKNTKKIILDIAEQINYSPNYFASGLRSKKSKTIGLIFNDIKNPMYFEIFGKIEEMAYKKNYNIIICSSDYNKDKEDKNINILRSREVDGYIISPSTENYQNILQIINNGKSVVIIDSIPKGEELSYVYLDHLKSGYIATKKLLDIGHKKIILLNGPHNLSSSIRFYKGYKNALNEFKIKLKKEYIYELPIDPTLSLGYIKEIFYRKDSLNFTAIVTLSDLIAAAVYKSAKQSGIFIPEEVSIIGYDDIFVADELSPSLTTVKQPKIKIGRLASELLFALIEDKDKKNETIILEPQLIVRESIKPLKN